MLLRSLLALCCASALASAKGSAPASGMSVILTGGIGALLGVTAGTAPPASARVIGTTETIVSQSRIGGIGAIVGATVGMTRPGAGIARNGDPATQDPTPPPQHPHTTKAASAPPNSSTPTLANEAAGSRHDPSSAPAGHGTEQTTAFSVWLDLNVLAKPGAAKPALPIWFESFQSEAVTAKDGSPPKTVLRLRLRRMPSLHRELFLRVFFDDLPELQPVVSAWSESGREQFRSAALGSGACLPTSDSVIVPLDGADYVDVEVAGDGTNIRGILASSLKEATARHTIDFLGLPKITDPFGNLAAQQEAGDDSKLFGRVKATLDTGIVQLSRTGSPEGVWEFQLANQPLTAVVTFEILNGDLYALPVVAANDGQPGLASVNWPDLADPGFRGESRPLEPGMRFQYTGWVRAQFVIPGHLLRQGANKIAVSLSEDSGPVAIRNVELQLKHNWRHFDYLLTPAHQ